MASPSRHSADIELSQDKNDTTLDEEYSGSDSDTDDGLIENWHEVVKEVLEETRQAFSSSPQFDVASPVPFQAYWHGIFTRLRDRVVSDARIPENLTSPPISKFNITLVASAPPGGCPCCLPSVEPNIMLENKQGVSKADFINGLTQYLYNECGTLPIIYRGGGDPSDKSAVEMMPKTGVLVYGADWMSSGDGPEGVRYAYTAGLDDTEVKIWIYCCPQGEFLAKDGELLQDYAHEDHRSTSRL
jgi:hypothetical protein